MSTTPYFVQLTDRNNKSLDINVTPDGKGGIPLNEIQQYQKQGVVGDVESISWHLPKF